MVARIKAIKPTRKFLLDINEIESAVEGTLDEDADEAEALFKETVKTWRTKVNFIKRKTAQGRSVWTTNEIYKFVDKGTKAHVITARRVPNLKFRSAGNYKPKTKVGELTSGPGAPADGDWVSKRSVNHPGNDARGFSAAIQEKMRKRNYTIWRRRSKGLFSPRGK